MHPDLQRRVDAAVAEAKDLQFLKETGLSMQAAKEFDIRVKRLQQEQIEIMRDLQIALAFDEALWAAAEIRLGRPPVDGEDTIEQEDIELAAAMTKTVLQSGTDDVQS